MQFHPQKRGRFAKRRPLFQILVSNSASDAYFRIAIQSNPIRSVPADGFFRYEQLRIRLCNDRQYHNRERSGRQGADAIHDDRVQPCAPAFRGVGSPEIVASDRVPEVTADRTNDGAQNDLPHKRFLVLIRDRLLDFRREQTGQAGETEGDEVLDEALQRGQDVGRPYQNVQHTPKETREESGNQAASQAVKHHDRRTNRYRKTRADIERNQGQHGR